MKNTDIALLVGELRGGMKALGDQVGAAIEKLGELPCSVNTADIQALKAWKADCNGANKEKIKEQKEKTLERFKGTISLRNGIIGIIVTAVISAAITLLTIWFTAGCPTPK
jgi:hypothetical protein